MSSQDSQDAQESSRQEEEAQKEQENEPSTTSVSVAVGTEDLNPESTTSQAEPTASTSRGTGEPEAEGSKGPKTCGVCGDKAKSMHFGGLSCDSCKAFFRRAVHNDAFMNFTCPYDGNCAINIASRKCCQYCRYKKCTSIGMERAWVMSEEDRAQLMKQRAERKAKQGDDGKKGLKDGKRELVPYEPDMATMLNYMTEQERDEVEQAVRNYQLAYHDVPYKNDLKQCNVGRPSVQIINMFTTVVRRFAYFARLFPDFCELPSQDQGSLLRGGILEMSLIRGVQSFDTDNNRWPNTREQIYKDAPTLRVEDMKKLVSCELYDMHMKFIFSMKDLNVDEPVMMLLLLIVLFTSDRPGLQEATRVQGRQDHYLQLIRKYMNWRYGPHNATIMYPRLLIKLTDLRELNDQHNEYNLKLAKQEVAEIQMQLGQLNLNPYTEWPHIMQHPSVSGSSSDPQARARATAGVFQRPPSVTSAMAAAATQAASTSKSGMGGQAEGAGGDGGAGAGAAAAAAAAAAMASMDFEQLANNPSFQKMIMQQFQKSIMNVLSSPNFGLGNLLPDGRSGQAPLQSDAPQQQLQPPPAQPPAQAPAIAQHLIQQQKMQQQQQQQSQSAGGQAPGTSQGGPSGFQSSDLMTQLDYLETNQPGNLQSIKQSQQAFQQLEHQLMSNIGGYGSYGEHTQHQLQQQYQQAQQQALMQQQQQHLGHQQELPEAMMIIPKEEPATPSPPGVQHIPQPQPEHHILFEEQHVAMRQVRQHMSAMHHSPPTQRQPQRPHPASTAAAAAAAAEEGDEGEISTPQKRSSLSDIGGLFQFRTLLEEFATLDNPEQLEQVKQILGPNLVTSLQQKLIASSQSASETSHHAPQHPPQHQHPPSHAPQHQHPSSHAPQHQHPPSHAPQHQPPPLPPHHQPQPQPPSAQHHHQPMPHAAGPPQPPPPPHHHMYMSEGAYPYFPGGEYAGPPMGAGYQGPSTSYPSSTHVTPPPPQYVATEPSSFCRSQHRITPPVMGGGDAPAPSTSFIPPDNTGVVYQYHPDVVHNVTTTN
ncbi:inactive histone-lysine N-methyltransferase 2E-like isoform X2 [Penaeus japonicus]|nr:inactive histone-lysine N-methyltransferase 2E-like isoform X2 [Penaeus japonicus]